MSGSSLSDRLFLMHKCCQFQAERSALVQARQAVYRCLKANQYDPKTLSGDRQSPYVLSKELGLQIILRAQSNLLTSLTLLS